MMQEKKVKICKWCGYSKHKDEGKHECPNIFIHGISGKEIIMRGKNLTIKWLGNAVLIEPKDDDAK